MLLSLRVPRFEAGPAQVTIRALSVAVGDAVAPGQALMDLLVDFSAGAAYDCPPVSLYRLTSRERAWVRRLPVEAGQVIEPGSPIATLSTDQGEELDGVAARDARTSFTSVVGEVGWWDDPA